MFYAEAILSRRGPLAKVWLAAHWERKLSKTQTLQTDISQSVDAIMGQEVVPMALRLSGQLLLGVCRIYSRKAKYLLDDCNEALLKIKMAFRPGLVDMTDEQLTVNRNAITIQGDGFDIDLMADAAWDFDFVDRPVGGQGQQHIARQADITLADNMTFDFDANYDFELGPADGIGSQDFGLDEFDIGVDFGEQDAAAPSKDKAKSKSKKNKGDGEEDEEEEGDADMSVEIGRDASVVSHGRRSELESALRAKGGDFDDFDVRSRGGLEDFGDAAADFGGDMQMDLDLGINFGDEERAPSERPKTPEAVRDASRASSPLSAPPATPPPQPEEGVTDRELTPRAEAPAKKKKSTLKKVIIDSVTELEDGPGARFGRGGLNSQARDVSEITAPVEFLPRSRTVMALMHIRQDPLAHFMPTVTNERGTFFCAAPPGMAPELTNLFLFPAHTPPKARRGRAAGASDTEGEGRSPKRARLATEDQEDYELGRRGVSAAPSVGVRSDIFGRDAGEISLGGIGADDMHMDIDGCLGGGELDIDIGGAVEDAKRRATSKAHQTPGPVSELEQDDLQIGVEDDRRSRYSTPADGFGDEAVPYSDVVCPIAAFDERPGKDSQTQTQTQQDEEDIGAESSKDGYSKQTVKAMGLLRKQFKTLELDNDATPRKTRRGAASTAEPSSKPVSFKKLSEKASRRAAASFFFELLVLGTRDCIKLNQSDNQKFDNIEILAKDKLWQTDSDMAGTSSRQPSAAPSDE
ncbi:sister chromatid cohesion protein 1 [Tulasnella sp. UAMH 9824]|nr:sister chromatid cohesion protein 1 [Tulasnella sp. UAMH 9824]